MATEIHLPAGATHLKPRLTLLDATMLVMGSMIGSGTFIVSADMARTMGSAGGLLLVWATTGVITLLGALAYGELAGAMPRAGGQYVFLREGLGPIWGFLYGWTLFMVIQTGTIAAVAVAFSRFLQVFFPAVTPDVFLPLGHIPMPAMQEGRCAARNILRTERKAPLDWTGRRAITGLRPVAEAEAFRSACRWGYVAHGVRDCVHGIRSGRSGALRRRELVSHDRVGRQDSPRALRRRCPSIIARNRHAAGGPGAGRRRSDGGPGSAAIISPAGHPLRCCRLIRSLC